MGHPSHKLNDYVTQQIDYQGKQYQITVYEDDPKRTDANPSSKPVFHLVPLGVRQPPYNDRIVIKCEELLKHLAANREENGQRLDAEGHGH